MELTKLRMVTIVAESILEERICARALELGASGFTVVESRGHGSLGRNAGEIPGVNVRIEIVVEDRVAEDILQGISKEYFNHYSVICFLSDVFVLRQDKYRKKGEAQG
jgi:nitrogen regulatory protein PII